MPTGKREVKLVNPLLKLDVKPIRNWHDWLIHWQATDNVQVLAGLLHGGFGVRLDQLKHEEGEYNTVDRISFYLSVADGWSDHELLVSLEDGDISYCIGYDVSGRVIKKPCQLRQALARKAFDMLGKYFFNTEFRSSDDWEINSWWEKVVISKELFPIIQAFFRVEEHSWRGKVIRNLSRNEKRSHNEQLAVDFLLELAAFLWKWDRSEPSWYSSPAEGEKIKNYLSETRARIEAAKPWMVEVLYYLGRLDLLQEWILKLDKACLDKLEEIAMRTRFIGQSHVVGDDGNRLVATLDEACYLDSKAALFLKRHNDMVKEHSRLVAIHEARMQQKIAAEKITKLTGEKQGEKS